MTEPDHRIVEYDRLNALGKVVYVGGQVARTVGQVIEAVVERTADIIGEAERAFRDALDGVEDAKIIDEAPRIPAGKRSDRTSSVTADQAGEGPDADRDAGQPRDAG